MQEAGRRTNRERTEATRSALIAAARRLFVDSSYAEVGTPQIVATAGVTRGALYHHFADKQALLRAVVEAEAAAVAAEIDARSDTSGGPMEALHRGTEAFLTAMSVPGRTRLLLLDGPAVLGRAIMDEIDGRHAARTLREGLGAAMEAGVIRSLPLDALTAQLSALFDRAALAIEAGDAPKDHVAVIAAVLAGLSRRT